MFEGLAEAIFELVPRATHLAIDLADDPDGRLNTVYARAKGHAPGERFPLSRAAVRRVQRDQAGVLLTNAVEEVGTESVMTAKILSILGVPLWDGDTIRGVLHVDNREGKGFFNEQDLDSLPTLAGAGHAGHRERAPRAAAASWPARSCAAR